VVLTHGQRSRMQRKAMAVEQVIGRYYLRLFMLATAAVVDHTFVHNLIPLGSLSNSFARLS